MQMKPRKTGSAKVIGKRTTPNRYPGYNPNIRRDGKGSKGKTAVYKGYNKSIRRD